MTREEAIDLLDNLIGMIEDNHNSDYDTAFKMAIKALEQGNVLQKIRAEIAEYKDDKIIHEERNEMIDIVLEIIDKHTKVVSE